MKRIFFVRVLLAFIWAIFGISFRASADSREDIIQRLIGVREPQLYACTNDQDCVLAPSFTECCEWQAVNKTFEPVVRSSAPVVFDAMASRRMKDVCARIDCIPGERVAICNPQSRCQAVPKKQ